MTILFAVLAGSALGVALRRGDFCFHSTWRQAFKRPPHTSLLRAYVVLLVISTPLVQLLRASDVIDPFVPTFAPAAAIVGGLAFGIGMVIAQTCVSGMFYKLGAGMSGMVVAITTWAIGDILTWQGPLQGLRERLNSNTVGTTTEDGSERAATLTTLLGPVGAIIAIAAGLGLTFWAIRNEQAKQATEPPVSDSASWSGFRLGAITAGIIVVAWLLVDWHGNNYPYGTSSTPSQVWDAVTKGQSISWWIPIALASVALGAILISVFDKTLWLRGETARRYVQLGGGGFVMGVGAAVAGGCNLGHSMVGVPLLSIGSIVTTVAIAGGVFLAARLTGG